MDKKVMITGVNAINIFNQNIKSQLEDMFDVILSKANKEDIEKDIKNYEPDIVILCITEDIDILIDIFNYVKSSKNIPVVLVGSNSACYSAEETIGKGNIINTIITPFKVDEIETVVNEYFKSLKNIDNENNEFDFNDDLDPQGDELDFNDDLDFQDNIDEDKEEKINLKVESDGVTYEDYNNLNNKGEKRKILIVDDDIKILRVMNAYLSSRYDVAIVKNGLGAMRYLRTNMPDLILLDYIMPMEDGPEVYRKIKLVDRLRKIPIFFLTGVSDSKKVRKALELKPEGYILKPIKRDQLIKRLESFFNTYVNK